METARKQTAAGEPARASALRVDGDRLTLRIRLTPNADRDAFSGITDTANGPALAARVRAVPEDGKANKALIKLAAKALGVAPSRLELASGAKDRVKVLTLRGADPALAARAAVLLRDAGAKGN